MADLERVLFLCPDLDNSGPTYNALTLSRTYQADGIKPLVAALHGGVRESSFAIADTPTLISGHLGLPLLGYGSLQHCRGFAPQVIHVLDHRISRRGERLSRALGIPLCITLNRSLSADTQGPWQEEKIRFIAVSDAVQTDAVQRQRIQRRQLQVIHNGVDLDRHPVGERPAALNGKERSRHAPVIGCFGSLLPHKGQDVLLQAAALVLKEHPEAEFLILGKGPELPRLRTLAEELKVAQRVTFAQGRPMTQKHSKKQLPNQESTFLRDLDIFVEPSYQEGLGLSVLQAMAWARPVVASGVGGLYSIVEDGITGHLVQKGDPQAFAQAILNLLNDPIGADEMGWRGRERIATEFNIQKVAQAHLELYQQCLDDEA